MERVSKALQFPVVIKGPWPSSFESQPLQEESKVTLADKIKEMFMKMFEVEDQSITKR